MARADKPISIKAPAFVHDDLEALLKQLASEEAKKTPLVAALIHAARETAARKALRKYKADLAEWRTEHPGEDPAEG